MNTQRHFPPTRRSMSATTSEPRPACHQRFTSSGVVHALQTRWRGASNSRVIRISVSDGSVTTAEPLPTGVTIALVLPFEFIQQVVQRVEALVPGALVVLHPVVDWLERHAVEPVQPLPALIPCFHKPHLPEDPQVLR